MRDRKLKFGKYKGQPIKKVILEHVGYIMWCLSNLEWFKLNEEEQAVYDAVAISIVKYDKKMVFPIDKMLFHVKDREALRRRETPVIVGENFNYATDLNNPVVKSVMAYCKKRSRVPQPNPVDELANYGKEFVCGGGYDINSTDIDRGEYCLFSVVNDL